MSIQSTDAKICAHACAEILLMVGLRRRWFARRQNARISRARRRALMPTHCDVRLRRQPSVTRPMWSVTKTTALLIFAGRGQTADCLRIA